MASPSLLASLASVSDEVEALVSARLQQLNPHLTGFRPVYQRSLTDVTTATAVVGVSDDDNDSDGDGDNGNEPLDTSDDSDCNGDISAEHQSARRARSSALALKDRRSKLPLRCVYLLRQWFTEHVSHPYPSEAEKKELAVATGLSVKQVSCWFTNNRRRIWKPFVAGSAAGTGASHDQQ